MPPGACGSCTPLCIGVPEKAWGSALTRALISSDYERDGTPRWDASHTIVPKPPHFTTDVARAAEAVRIGPGRTTDVAARANRLLSAIADPYARHLGWMPRNHPLVLPDGTVLVPLANENVNMAAMALAHDGGATWTFSSLVPTAGVIQPSVIRLGDGTLQAYFRDARGTGRIGRSTSADQGRTWSEASATDLPNPSGGIEAIVLRSGAIAVVHNDHSGQERDRLSIALSTDGGRTWPTRKVIVHVPGGRFDYPSIIQARDGRVHVTFSDNLKTIRHVSFSEGWIASSHAGLRHSAVRPSLETLTMRQLDSRLLSAARSRSRWTFRSRALYGFTMNRRTFLTHSTAMLRRGRPASG